MTLLLHDHAGTGLCAVAPSGRILGMSDIFVRALGVDAPPAADTLHRLLPLPPHFRPEAGWSWLLDIPPTSPGSAPHAPGAAMSFPPDSATVPSPTTDIAASGGDSPGRDGQHDRNDAPCRLGGHDGCAGHGARSGRDAHQNREGRVGEGRGCLLIRSLPATALPQAMPGGLAGHTAASGKDGAPHEQEAPCAVLLAHPPDTHLPQALSLLATGLAHDFGNAVASVLGFTEIAISRLSTASAPQDPMLARSLDNIMTGCQRARDVIGFAQSVAGRVELNVVPCHLAPLLRTWCGELAAGLAAEAAEGLSSGALPPAGPPVGVVPELAFANACPDEGPRVHADPARLREAFEAILRNALWAVRMAAESRKGGQRAAECIHIETSPAEPCPRRPGAWLRLRVRDCGNGMDADTLLHALDPYFSTRPRHGGKGRGLARAKGIVHAHGGLLDIITAPDHGCIVDILLPVAHGG